MVMLRFPSLSKQQNDLIIYLKYLSFWFSCRISFVLSVSLREDKKVYNDLILKKSYERASKNERDLHCLNEHLNSYSSTRGATSDAFFSDLFVNLKVLFLQEGSYQETNLVSHDKHQSQKLCLLLFSSFVFICFILYHILDYQCNCKTTQQISSSWGMIRSLIGR